MFAKTVWHRLVVVASIASLWLLAGSRALGQEAPSPNVMTIQEDWVLVLNVPDDSVNCPQFHTIMSPGPDLSSRYFQANWNYREQPDFAPGGLELLDWQGDTLLRQQTCRTEQLSTSAETISWTQQLWTDGSIVAFVIFNGNSTTWGSFFTLSWGSTPGLNDLNGYSPDVSVENSWITYGSNRVDLLVIAQVRYYDADGNLLKTDETPRVVYKAPSSDEN